MSAQTDRRALRLTCELGRVREAAQFLAGDRYATRIEEWVGLVRHAMERDRLDAIPAATALADLTTDGIAQMWVMAAAVEIIERGATTARGAHA
jgi:hypothetical protein